MSVCNVYTPIPSAWPSCAGRRTLSSPPPGRQRGLSAGAMAPGRAIVAWAQAQGGRKAPGDVDFPAVGAHCGRHHPGTRGRGSGDLHGAGRPTVQAASGARIWTGFKRQEAWNMTAQEAEQKIHEQAWDRPHPRGLDRTRVAGAAGQPPYGAEVRPLPAPTAKAPPPPWCPAWRKAAENRPYTSPHLWHPSESGSR